MRKIKILVLMSSLVMALSGLGLAQSNVDSHQVTMTVSDVALLAVIGGNITLTIGAPGTPGLPPGDATNSTCRLQYTALVSPSTARRTITVAWAAGDFAPAGTQLSVTATPAGLGSGASEGTSAGSVIISDLAQPVVTGIASCYTGTGGGDGAQLAYVLAITNAGNLVSGETHTATVTYTLTDAV